MLRKVNGLKPIADELGVPLSQLAIAWCAANPNVSSVITGATKESQVSFIHAFSKIDMPQICDPMHLFCVHLLFLFIHHLTLFESSYLLYICLWNLAVTRLGQVNCLILQCHKKIILLLFTILDQFEGYKD